MPIELNREEVHLWRAALDVSAERLRALAETLSPDERARAARFHFPQDQRRFTAARGALRWVLGRYLESEPGRLRFSYGRYGKPFLDGQPELQFNLSHCRELAVYAVCLGRPVGVDLECLSQCLDFEGIANRFFTPQERQVLAAAPAGQRASAFFRCWTRREAYLKARGEGLGALATATVEPMPGWTVVEFSPEADFVAAVVVEGEGCQLRLFQYLSQCSTSESGRLDFSGASAG